MEVNGTAVSDREFYQKLGICPRCRKNKLYGNERQCPGCNAEAYIKVMGSRDRKHYNLIHSEWARKEYQRRKSQGQQPGQEKQDHKRALLFLRAACKGRLQGLWKALQDVCGKFQVQKDPGTDGDA